MSHRFVSVLCLMVLFSIAVRVNGQIFLTQAPSDNTMTEEKAVEEIMRRITADNYRRRPAVAIATMLSKTTCLIQAVEECVLLGNTYRSTPSKALKCIDEYTKRGVGPCAVDSDII